MKTKINTTLLTVFFSLIFCVGLSAQSQQATPVQKKDTGLVQVYYFHFNTRCETCRAVESETKLDLQILFGDDVEFQAVNLDEKAGEAKGKELGVESQVLLVVKGEKRIDLTNDGFLYALTNPNKFRGIIEENIKPLL